jgi:hypothetical protein
MLTVPATVKRAPVLAGVKEERLDTRLRADAEQRRAGSGQKNGSSRRLLICIVDTGPGGSFVIEGAGRQTAVQDAHQAVG